jgi:hypothetical protein
MIGSASEGTVPAISLSRVAPPPGTKNVGSHAVVSSRQRAEQPFQKMLLSTDCHHAVCRLRFHSCSGKIWPGTAGRIHTANWKGGAKATQPCRPRTSPGVFGATTPKATNAIAASCLYITFQLSFIRVSQRVASVNHRACSEFSKGFASL